jgi:N4-gp56 family major capsid protein
MNVFGSYVPFTDDLDIYGEDGARFKKDVTTNLGGAAGQSQETIIFATAAANATNIVFDTDLEKTLKTAELALRNALAIKFTSMITGSTKYSTTPIRPAFVGFVTPEGALKLEDELVGFVPVEKYGYSDGLLPNEIGSYRGVRFCETTLWQNTSNDTLQALIIGDEAVAETGIRGMKKIETIIKELGDANGGDFLNRNGSIGSKFRLAVAALRPDHIALVELEPNV